MDSPLDHFSALANGGGRYDQVAVKVKTSGPLCAYQYAKLIKQDMAQKIQLMKNKGEEIKMKDRKQDNQSKTLMKATLNPDLEKIQSMLQGEKFTGNVLTLGLDHIKLLHL